MNLRFPLDQADDFTLDYRGHAVLLSFQDNRARLEIQGIGAFDTIDAARNAIDQLIGDAA